MKVGIFIDNFYSTQAEKDPGLIGLFLSEKHEVVYYCFNTDLNTFQNILIHKISKDEATSGLFWKKEHNDYLIFYSWLSLKFSKIIKAINKNNSALILKMDSDGHLIFPLRPTYLRAGLQNYSFKSLSLFLIRHIQWFVFPKFISRQKIEQIKSSNAVIIESPRALANLQSSLKYWGLENLNARIFFIPNPITLSKARISDNKENIILSVGRWDDKRKNAKAIVEIFRNFYCLHGWSFILVGNGSSFIKDKILAKNKHLNIRSFESMAHHKLLNLASKTKIFFAPSLCESFGIAAAESLGNGCSLVGTPLESFEYLTNNSKFGTLSKDFSIIEIKKALTEDIKKWENNTYNPEEIKSFIEKNLNPKTVSLEIEKVMETI